MADASIPVDLLNPGQVFACIGFAEAADVLLGDAEGCFDWSNRGAAQFRLRASGRENPIEHVLRFLSRAHVIAEAPHGSTNIDGWLSTWGPRPIELPRGAPYPSEDPDSAAVLAVVLEAESRRVRVDYWADAAHSGDRPNVITGRDNAKFWGGSRGKPAAAFIRDMLSDEVRMHALRVSSDPFNLMAPLSSSFDLDWRRSYVPIDAGFSLNEHKSSMTTTGFPLVDLLGAIGLTNARPHRVGTRFDLLYRYGVVGTSSDAIWLPIRFLRAGLGAAASPFESRHFRMFLSWSGKEGQLRSITRVTEETES